jgi:Flp pilus assembly protein CpaB
MRLRYLRRWSPAAKALLLISVACGIAAFVSVRGYVGRLEALRPAVGDPVRVLVAAVHLPRGAPVEPAALETRSVPSAFVPPGALADPGRAAGRTLLADLAAGEILTESRLADAELGPVAALVPPGLRAFAIEPALPPGAVGPGDRVDVLATFGGERPRTETVASGLEVILVLDDPSDPPAVNAGGTGGPTGPGLVLLVGPEQAERLAFASAFAELSVAVTGGQPDLPVDAP